MNIIIIIIVIITIIMITIIFIIMMIFIIMIIMIMIIIMIITIIFINKFDFADRLDDLICAWDKVANNSVLNCNRKLSVAIHYCLQLQTYPAKLFVISSSKDKGLLIQLSNNILQINSSEIISYLKTLEISTSSLRLNEQAQEDTSSLQHIYHH